MGEYFDIKESRIFPKKYYCYYYTYKYRVNLVPISFYSILQARFTLRGQFGKEYVEYFKIIQGKKALERGWKLGKIGIMLHGKYHQIKKYHIPPEYDTNKITRKAFSEKLKKILKNGKRSMINRFTKKYMIWAK